MGTWKFGYDTENKAKFAIFLRYLSLNQSICWVILDFFHDDFQDEFFFHSIHMVFFIENFKKNLNFMHLRNKLKSLQTHEEVIRQTEKLIETE